MVTTEGFVRCRQCGRLNLCQQRCDCWIEPPMECDCTYDGSRQNIGALCDQRIKDVWADVIRRRVPIR